MRNTAIIPLSFAALFICGALLAAEEPSEKQDGTGKGEEIILETSGDKKDDKEKDNDKLEDPDELNLSPSGMPNVNFLTPEGKPLKGITPKDETEEKGEKDDAKDDKGAPVKENYFNQNKDGKNKKETEKKTSGGDKQKEEFMNEQDEFSLGKAPTDGFGFDLNFLYKTTNSFSLGSNHNYQDASWGKHLLRLSPTFRFKEFDFKVSIDFLRGMLWGEKDAGSFNRPLNLYDYYGGKSLKSFRLRELYFDWKSDAGLLKVGLQSHRWGLGILMNDGEDDNSRFGDAWYGDYYARVMYAAKPLLPLYGASSAANNFIAAAAFDFVYADQFADITDSDLAMQGFIALMYDTKAVKAGLLGGYRWQEYKNGDKFQTGTLDAYVKLRGRSFNSEWRDVEAKFDGEIAYLEGSRSYKADTAKCRDGCRAYGLGAVARGSLFFPFFKMEPGLEFGYASGEGDDSYQHGKTFFFNPDYKVGLLAYDEILRVHTQNYEPWNSSGFARLSSEGRVFGSYYIFPTLRLLPVDFGEFLAGVLIVWVGKDMSVSYEDGGVNYKSMGSMGYRLGEEIDISYTHWWKLPGGFSLSMRFQAAYWTANELSYEENYPASAAKMFLSATLKW